MYHHIQLTAFTYSHPSVLWEGGPTTFFRYENLVLRKALIPSGMVFIYDSYTSSVVLYILSRALTYYYMNATQIIILYCLRKHVHVEQNEITVLAICTWLHPKMQKLSMWKDYPIPTQNIWVLCAPGPHTRRKLCGSRGNCDIQQYFPWLHAILKFLDDQDLNIIIFNINKTRQILKLQLKIDILLTFNMVSLKLPRQKFCFA